MPRPFWDIRPSLSALIDPEIWQQRKETNLDEEERLRLAGFDDRLKQALGRRNVGQRLGRADDKVVRRICRSIYRVDHCSIDSWASVGFRAKTKGR